MSRQVIVIEGVNPKKVLNVQNLILIILIGVTAVAFFVSRYFEKMYHGRAKRGGNVRDVVERNNYFAFKVTMAVFLLIEVLIGIYLNS